MEPSKARMEDAARELHGPGIGIKRHAFHCRLRLRGGSAMASWKSRNRRVIVTGGAGESQSTVPLKVAWRGESRRIGSWNDVPTPSTAIAAGASGPNDASVIRHGTNAHRRRLRSPADIIHRGAEVIGHRCVGSGAGSWSGYALGPEV
jgi:hypothetical protein